MSIWIVVPNRWSGQSLPTPTDAVAIAQCDFVHINRLRQSGMLANDLQRRGIENHWNALRCDALRPLLFRMAAWWFSLVVNPTPSTMSSNQRSSNKCESHYQTVDSCAMQCQHCRMMSWTLQHLHRASANPWYGCWKNMLAPSAVWNPICFLGVRERKRDKSSKYMKKISEMSWLIEEFVENKCLRSFDSIKV